MTMTRVVDDFNAGMRVGQAMAFARAREVFRIVFADAFGRIRGRHRPSEHDFQRIFLPAIACIAAWFEYDYYVEPDALQSLLRGYVSALSGRWNANLTVEQELEGVTTEIRKAMKSMTAKTKRSAASTGPEVQR